MDDVPGQTPNQTPPAPKVDQSGSAGISWGKIVLTVAIILAVTAALAGGYWYLVLNKSESNVNTAPIKVSTPSAKVSTKSATPSAKKVDTSDWKTYKGRTDGFSQFGFKYPPTWLSGDPTIGSPYNIATGNKDYYVGEGCPEHFAQDGEAFLRADSDYVDTETSLSAFVYDQRKHNPFTDPATRVEERTLKIGGREAMEFIYTNGNTKQPEKALGCSSLRKTDVVVKVVTIEKNGKKFWIDFRYSTKGSNSYASIFEAILSTFKFL